MKISRFACALLSLSLLAGCGLNPGDLLKPGTPSASPAAGSSASASASTSVGVTVPDPLEVAHLTSLSSKSCSEESSSKSLQSTSSTSITFKNSTSSKIRIYWLDFNGKRVEYSKSGHQASSDGGLEAGASYTQQTFVTHPWLITDDQGNCQGIYYAPGTGGGTVDVVKTEIVAGGTASTSGDAAGMQSRIDCLKAKGKTAEATTVQAELNLYLAAQKQGGLAVILGNAHLASAQEIAAKAGC